MCRKFYRIKDNEVLGERMSQLYESSSNIVSPHVLMELDTREWNRMLPNSILLSGKKLITIDDRTIVQYQKATFGSSVNTNKRRPNYKMVVLNRGIA